MSLENLINSEFLKNIALTGNVKIGRDFQNGIIKSLEGVGTQDLMYYPQLKKTEKYSPQADLLSAYDLDVGGDSFDGAWISSNIKEYHQMVNKEYGMNINTTDDDTLDFTYAEMIIDLKGLFDGKAKIIKFNPEI